MPRMIVLAISRKRSGGIVTAAGESKAQKTGICRI